MRYVKPFRNKPNRDFRARFLYEGSRLLTNAGPTLVLFKRRRDTLTRRPAEKVTAHYAASLS